MRLWKESVSSRTPLSKRNFVGEVSMKAIVGILAFLSFASSAHALRLHYYGETAIATGTKFKNTTIGGISGIVWNDGNLIALSDDRVR